HMPEMDGFTVARQVRLNPELDGTTILMLTSAARPDDITLCRELGIRAYLTKPIKPSSLLDAILSSLSTLLCPVAPVDQEAQVVECGPGAGERGRPLRILLVEDHIINQKLVMTILQKEGHTVVLANNGREAVALLGVGGTDGAVEFDLVLMD